MLALTGHVRVLTLVSSHCVSSPLNAGISTICFETLKSSGLFNDNFSKHGSSLAGDRKTSEP